MIRTHNRTTALGSLAACLIACATPVLAEIPTNPTPAELLTRAQAGDKDAQFAYGDLLMFREDTPPDEAEAFAWYQKAADQGHTRAQYMVGQIYSYDPSLPYYMGNAIYWFEKAAEADNRQAQYELGNLLVSMTVVISYHYPDAEEGMMWLHKAADKGYAKAEYKLGAIYGHDLDGVRIQVVPRDQMEAIKWYRAAAEHGSGDATYQMMIRSRDGIGVPKSHIEAVRWARHLLSENVRGEMEVYAYTSALTMLGAALMDGRDVEQDYLEARERLERAAEHDVAEAQYRLSVIYAKGLGVKKDAKIAAEWRRKAEDNGYESDVAYEPDKEEAPNLKTMFATDDKMLALSKPRSDAMRLRE